MIAFVCNPSSEGLISNGFQRLNFRGLGATGGIARGEICVAACWLGAASRGSHIASPHLHSLDCTMRFDMLGG